MAMAAVDAREYYETSLSNETMRRPTKVSSVAKPSTNLDLMPSHDYDGVDNSKMHNNRKSATSMSSSLAIAIFCGLIALGTLFSVSNKVLLKSRSMGGGINTMVSDAPTHNTVERFLPQQNRLLPPDSIYRTEVEDIHGNWTNLMEYSGGISLIINVACE